MSPILLVIILLLLMYKLYLFAFEKPLNVPPCIPRLPIWGSYWLLLWGNYKFPYKAIPYYVQKYKSKLLSCYLGKYFVVVANDYESIKELLSRREFDGRMNDSYVILARSFGKKLGIFFTEGVFWQEQRRFALRNMRDFGFGRRMEKLENDMEEEIAILVDMLKHGPINDEEKTVVRDGMALFPDILYPYAANCIWTIMSGEKLSRNEYEKLRHICRSAMTFQRSLDSSGGAVTQTPWLRFFGNTFGYTDFISGTNRIIQFVKEYINNQNFGCDNDSSRGFIEKYMQRLQKNEEHSTFSQDQLILLVVDFMFPSLSAIPSAITVLVKFMLQYPEVMKKVQKEIDSVVGRDRLPTLNNRNKLPYTEATIRETMRMETSVPLAIGHKATENTTLNGYNIPVNTWIITNLDAMHHDPDLWGDPENFRPERFLTEDGKLGKDFTLSFGAGRRLCAGETFARQIIFLSVCMLAQNFDFSIVPGQPTRLTDKCFGLVITPKEVWIKVTPRN